MSKTIEEILENYPGSQREYLQCILQDIQAEWGYLSEENIVKVSKFMNISSASVFGTASFYSQFRLSPLGKYNFRICQGSACHLMGNENLLKLLERNLKTKAGETSKNGLFSIEVVDCMGACHLSPLISVNGRFYPQQSEGSLLKIIEELTNNEH